MPVIVNELEVVLEAPPATSSRDPDLAAPAAAPPPLTPLEVAALLERRARNALRLFAH